MLLFDFDGTLADSLPVLVNLIKKLAPEFNYKLPQPTSEIIEELRDIPLDTIIKKLNISIFALPLLIKRIKDELNQQSKTLQPIPGIPDVLKQLNNKGYKLGILTSNSYESVKKFLHNNGLDFCDAVYSDIGIFGKHTALNHFLTYYKLSPQDIVYIGDEVRDIKAAQKTGIRIIAVSWGFNGPSLLQAAHPDFLVSTPSQLLEVIEQYYAPLATPKN